MVNMASEEKVENLIYEVRGVQVMLDSDLARLYGCKNGTKSLNLAVKRHINKFSERYMFQLSKEEYVLIRSRFQVETLNKSNNFRGQNMKYLPYAFTEEGVAMLATVLKTLIADEISIKIMDAFVNMRHFIKNNVNVVSNRLDVCELKLNEHEGRINELFSKFETNDYRELIFFEGQMYDAYSKIIDILKQAKDELIIVDAYADKNVLDIICKLNVKVILVVKSISLVSRKEIEIYGSQYNNLKVVYSDNYHDRYFIIDRRQVYHSGTSINHAGSQVFSINKLEDKEIIDLLIQKVIKLKNNVIT